MLSTEVEAVEYRQGPLSEEEFRRFWELGYHVIKGAVSREEAAYYRDAILDLVPRNLVFPPSWSCHDGRLKPHQLIGDKRDQTIDIPELIPLLGNERLYAVACQLLGSEQLRARDCSVGITLRNDASRDGQRSQSVHIDASVPVEDDFDFTLQELQVGGCYYFNDVRPGGGGIHIVPGGHRRVEQEVRESDNGRHLYSDWKDIPYDTVEMTGEAGDFVMLHHLMPHAAAHNRLAEPRVAQFTRFLRVDQSHGYGRQPARRYTDAQLAVMSPLLRKLLGLDSW